MEYNPIKVEEQVPVEGQIVVAFDTRMHHCIFSNGKFYRHTENPSNERISSFYYPNITSWIPELTATPIQE